MKTVTIVGAGCSAGLAGLAMDSDFLNRYESDINSRYFLLEAIKKLFGNINTSYGASWKSQRLEVCWNEIDENYNSRKMVVKSEEIDEWMKKWIELTKKEARHTFKYYSTYLHSDTVSRSPQEYFFLFAGWELKKAVVNAYSLTLDSSLRTKYQKLITKINSLTNTVPVHYISFNYDVLLEQALENYSYVGLNPKAGTLHKTDRPLVIKPHGSVSWLHEENQLSTAPRPFSCENIGYHNDTFSQHAVVGLVGNKRELVPSADGNIINFTFAEKILPEVTQAVAQAEQLVILGYSFPITDGYVKAAFIKAKPKNLKQIHVVTKKGGKEDVGFLLEKVSQLFSFPKEDIDLFDNGVEGWIER